MLRRVGRALLLVTVALIQGAVALLVLIAVNAWFGELTFPGIGGTDWLIRDPPDSLEQFLFVYGMPLGVALASAAFIAPLAPPVRLRATGRTIRSSVIAAGFIGGGLAFGATAALMELIVLLTTGDPIGGHPVGIGPLLASIGLVVAIGWIAWTAALWKYSRRADHSAAARILSLVFRGSLIELGIAIPAYAYARSREECYCGLATFWALCCGVGGLLFVAGPGALLLWYRRRGQWVDEGTTTTCPKCGYRRAAGAGPRCPECGAAWGAAP